MCGVGVTDESDAQLSVGGHRSRHACGACGGLALGSPTDARFYNGLSPSLKLDRRRLSEAPLALSPDPARVGRQPSSIRSAALDASRDAGSVGVGVARLVWRLQMAAAEAPAPASGYAAQPRGFRQRRDGVTVPCRTRCRLKAAFRFAAERPLRTAAKNPVARPRSGKNGPNATLPQTECASGARESCPSLLLSDAGTPGGVAGRGSLSFEAHVRGRFHGHGGLLAAHIHFHRGFRDQDGRSLLRQELGQVEGGVPAAGAGHLFEVDH